MQALLFGRAELTLFESPAVRRQALEYLARIIQLGGWLGARALVFGSPLNRRVQGRALKEMLPLACDTFRWLGDQARACGTCFCIEANHSVYGCDFVTTLAEAVELVQHVAHPGFGLHLDAGGLALTGESLANLSVQPRHYHISEPHLAPVGSADTDHATLARQLVQLGYHGWLSVEVRESPRWRDNLRAALEHARRDYRPILRLRENCDGTAPPDSDGPLPGAGADPGQLQNLPRLAGH
jgi:sugar phosphate isomerase/epimerase